GGEEGRRRRGPPRPSGGWWPPADARSAAARSGDRDVPEQRRGELEHAAHRLAIRRGQDPLAERHVHHLVVRDLLDLLGELLLLYLVRGASPLDLQLFDAPALGP